MKKIALIMTTFVLAVAATGCQNMTGKNDRCCAKSKCCKKMRCNSKCGKGCNMNRNCRCAKRS